MLKSANVNRSFLGRIKITSAYAKVTGWTNHAAGEAERIVRQDRLGRTIIIPVRDRGDEGFDIQLRGTGFLARCIDAF